MNKLQNTYKPQIVLTIFWLLFYHYFDLQVFIAHELIQSSRRLHYSAQMRIASCTVLDWVHRQFIFIIIFFILCIISSDSLAGSNLSIIVFWFKALFLDSSVDWHDKYL